MGERLQQRMDQGFKFLKMDVGIDLIKDEQGTIVAPPGMLQSTTVMHPFTGIQITDKGIERLCAYVSAVRDVIGYETATGGRSLRTYWRRVVHSLGTSAGSVYAGMVRGHDSLAAYGPICEALASGDYAGLYGRGHSLEGGILGHVSPACDFDCSP